jgi:hypothetical protein
VVGAFVFVISVIGYARVLKRAERRRRSQQPQLGVHAARSSGRAELRLIFFQLINATMIFL